MEIWKFLFCISFIGAGVVCEDRAQNEIESNDVALEPSDDDSFIRHKKSHPSTLCIPGINDAACTSSNDEEYTVSSSSNYFAGPVQPGYGPSAQQQPSLPYSHSSVQPGYGQPPPAQQPPSHAYSPQPQYSHSQQPAYGSQPSHYGQPQPYRPTPQPSSLYGPAPPPQQPPKHTYSVPPPIVPPRSLYSTSPYRSIDMMDNNVHRNEMIDNQMYRNDMMDNQVGSFLPSRPHQHCVPIPYQPAPAPVAPPPCAQQFTVSCSPQIYATSKTPAPMSTYYPAPVYQPPRPTYPPPAATYYPAPVYQPPRPTYPPPAAPSPIVYSPDPVALHALHLLNQQQHAMQQQGQQSPIIPPATTDQQMMDNKQTSTTPTMRNEQTAQQPKNMMSNNDQPKVQTQLLKMNEQLKDSDKKNGPQYGWEH